VDDDEITLTTGSVSGASGSSDDNRECPIATLWLPDPETWRGWSMRHVWKKDDPKPRHFGFRRGKP
jgi:hypothetical protein